MPAGGDLAAHRSRWAGPIQPNRKTCDHQRTLLRESELAVATVERRLTSGALMTALTTLFAAVMLTGCGWSNWGGGGGYPGGYGYGYPAYGGYRGGYGYPLYGYGGGSNGYYYGYNRAREEDWRRWQAYQYGLSQGRKQAQQPGVPPPQGGSQPPRQQLPYGITRNPGGTYHVPGRGNFTAGQIQNYVRKHRR